MLLTGTLYNAGGPLPSVRIKLTPSKTSLNGLLRGAEYNFTTDPEGNYSQAVEAGYYDVFRVESGRDIPIGRMIADADSETTLPAAMNSAITPIDQQYAQDVLAHLEATQEEVQRLADEAALSEQNAAQAATDAVNNIIGPIFDEINGVVI